MEECVICKEDLCKFKIVELECNHKFHQKCIFTWLNSDRIDCPCCRKVLIDPQELEIQKRNVYEVISCIKDKLLDFWYWLNNETYIHRPAEMILIMLVIFLIGMTCAFIIDHSKFTSAGAKIELLLSIIDSLSKPHTNNTCMISIKK